MFTSFCKFKKKNLTETFVVESIFSKKEFRSDFFRGIFTKVSEKLFSKTHVYTYLWIKKKKVSNPWVSLVLFRSDVLLI